MRKATLFPLLPLVPTSVWVLLWVSFLLAHSASAETALDRYVAKPDPAYQWKLAHSFQGEHAGHGYTAHVLELTSQSWRPSYEVDRPLWKHWLTITIPVGTIGTIGSTGTVPRDTGPAGASRGTAMLYIGGGRNGSDPPTTVAERSARIAVETRSVVADLGQVPNQPLYFADSRQHGRKRDSDGPHDRQDRRPRPEHPDNPAKNDRSLYAPPLRRIVGLRDFKFVSRSHVSHGPEDRTHHYLE